MMITARGATIKELVIRKLLPNNYIIADENQNFVFCGDSIDLCSNDNYKELLYKRVRDIGYEQAGDKDHCVLILYINSKET